MTKKQIFIAAVVVLMMFSASYYGACLQDKKSGKEDTASQDAAFHLAYSMDKGTYGHLEAAGRESGSGERIYGGIVSHHLLAAKEIAKFFAAFQGQDIKTMVIIGPNHFNTGDGSVLVSRYPYETPWGIVEPDTEVIDRLLSERIVSHEEAPFANEHSVSSLVSFVRYYLPDARIVPIILKRNVSESQADRLAAVLAKILPEESTVIASADFSHHLTKLAADFHDEKSVADINDFDYDGLAQSEIDSPVSIRVLLKLLETRGAKKMGWERTSSAEILADPYYEDVTSYLFAHFTAGTSEKESKITILSFGDIFAEQSKADSLFEKIRGREGNFLRGADIISAGVVGSFLGSDCAAGTLTVKELGKAGINLLTLANDSPRLCTDELETKGIGYFQTDTADENSSFRMEKNGRKVAVLGVRGDAGSTELGRSYKRVAESKQENDQVIVSVRWGDLKGAYPKKVIARALIDSGAGLVLGYGDELGSAENYMGKMIFSSLGTFPSRDGSGQDRVGVGAVFGNEVVRYYIFPLKPETSVPELMGPQEAEVFCAGYLHGIEGVQGCRFEMRNNQS